MDNFFSNPTLFEELAKETINCCGTARRLRTVFAVVGSQLVDK
jgi:hypothetical protein